MLKLGFSTDSSRQLILEEVKSKSTIIDTIIDKAPFLPLTVELILCIRSILQYSSCTMLLTLCSCLCNLMLHIQSLKSYC